jgi:hypothetical protein
MSGHTERSLDHRGLSSEFGRKEMEKNSENREPATGA